MSVVSIIINFMLNWLLGPILIGSVITYMWQWFIIPLFPATLPVPTISLFHGYGLALLFRMLTGTYSLFTYLGVIRRLTEEETIIFNLTVNLTIPIIIFVLGSIAYWFSNIL